MGRLHPLLLALCAVAVGCARAYYPNAPNLAADRPCQTYALLNSGLSSYIPFADLATADTACKQVSPACTEPVPRPVGQTLPIRPGTLLRIYYFPLDEEGKNQRVPGLSAYEYRVPPPKAPLSRRDFFFLSYLLSASFPDAKDDTARPLKDLQQLAEGEHCLGVCGARSNDASCIRSCKEALVRGAIDSLVYYATPDPPQALPWASASGVRAWLNPAPQQARTDATRLGFVFAGVHRSLFGGWGDAYFSASPYDEANSQRHGHSSLYGEHVTSGRALVEVEIPVRIESEPSSRYVPIYWSLADLEEATGARVVGLRRKREFLSQALLSHLIPDATCKELVAAGSDSFTLWLQRRFPWGLKSSAGHGASGFLVAQRSARQEPDAWVRLRRETLLAPGDIVLVTATAEHR
jgi:hypothetical protein